jgi:DNA ligase (NAD+)
MNSTIDNLAARLVEASNAYYNHAPIVTDREFDALESELRRLDPSHPVLKAIGSPVEGSGWTKVSHPYPMGSLEKAQDATELTEWAKGKQDFFISEKMDGISILLTYEGGSLVRACTRGDGVVGEDITRNVKLMHGVPHNVPDTTTLYVRGEIVCTKADFSAHFPGESNPRNTASGTSKRQTGWDKCQHLTVYAYDLSQGSVMPAEKQGEFAILRSYGFKTPVSYWAGSVGEILVVYQAYINYARDVSPYEIDGLVVELNDPIEQIRLGYTPDGMRPKGAIAFKFPHDSKPTVLLDVIWQVGQSGRVTPVAVFEPVVLGGASITHASLHNIANVDRLVTESKSLFLAAGESILVSRRNDVIPYVESILTSGGVGEILNTPHRCPDCDSSLVMDGEYLMCPNTDECPSQILGGIRRWIMKTGVLHFGEAMIAAVVDAGMVTILGDLYRLDLNQVSDLKVEGRKVGGAAKRALGSLHQNKNLTLDTFVGSLGIPLCGRRMVGMLMEGGFTTLESLRQATVAELAAVPNFGTVKAVAFRDGFDARTNMINDLLLAGVTIVTPVVLTQTSTALQGVSVCFTGFRDSDLEDSIVAAGGVIKSGVSKGLTYLVTKDPTSTSGKAQKARDLGTKVISPDEMKLMVVN